MFEIFINELCDGIIGCIIMEILVMCEEEE